MTKGSKYRIHELDWKTQKQTNKNDRPYPSPHGTYAVIIQTITKNNYLSINMINAKKEITN